MILAAGRGERLRPLTDRVPKPLIEVGGKSLIERHIGNLADAGIQELVINLSHLGDQIEAKLGDGSRLGVNIVYSYEPPGALETGGGIFQALAMTGLGSGPFAVVNGDILTDYPFTSLREVEHQSAHLVLVPNPDHNPSGDFSLDEKHVNNTGGAMATFSGIAVYHPSLFDNCSPGRFSIVPLLRTAIRERQVTGEIHRGYWSDVGTPERLEAARSLV